MLRVMWYNVYVGVVHATHTHTHTYIYIYTVVLACRDLSRGDALKEELQQEVAAAAGGGGGAQPVIEVRAYMYVYVCICVYICVYIYIYVCTCVYIQRTTHSLLPPIFFSPPPPPPPSQHEQALQLDIASLPSVWNFLEEWGRHGQPIHILVNNAGVFHMSGAFYYLFHTTPSHLTSSPTN